VIHQSSPAGQRVRPQPGCAQIENATLPVRPPAGRHTKDTSLHTLYILFMIAIPSSMYNRQLVAASWDPTIFTIVLQSCHVIQRFHSRPNALPRTSSGISWHPTPFSGRPNEGTTSRRSRPALASLIHPNHTPIAPAARLSVGSHKYKFPSHRFRRRSNENRSRSSSHSIYCPHGRGPSAFSQAVR